MFGYIGGKPKTNANGEYSKVEIITQGGDQKCATFVIMDEDHTLGNSLRYVIAKNPDVEFVGYAIPHPSEAKINLRIQTRKGTALDALYKGLDDLNNMCQHISQSFEKSLESGSFSTETNVEVGWLAQKA